MRSSFLNHTFADLPKGHTYCQLYYSKQYHYLLFIEFLYCSFPVINVSGQATPLSGIQSLPCKREGLDMKITEVPAKPDLLRLVHQLLSPVQKVLCKLCNLSSQQSEQIFTVRSTHSCTLQSALFKLLTHLVSCVNKFFVCVCENKVWPTDISFPCHLWHILGLIKCEFLCETFLAFSELVVPLCPFIIFCWCF